MAWERTRKRSLAPNHSSGANDLQTKEAPLHPTERQSAGCKSDLGHSDRSCHTHAQTATCAASPGLCWCVLAHALDTYLSSAACRRHQLVAASSAWAFLARTSRPKFCLLTMYHTEPCVVGLTWSWTDPRAKICFCSARRTLFPYSGSPACPPRSDRSRRL